MSLERTMRGLQNLIGCAAVMAAILFSHPQPAKADIIDCETIGVGSLSVDAASIALGGSTTLHWFLDAPNGCPVWVNGSPVAMEKGDMVISPQTLTSYTLTTVGPGGTQRELDTLSVSVTPDCMNEVTGFVRTMPRTVHKGYSSVLSWYANAPSQCQFTYAVNAVAQQASGSKRVNPLATTEYALTAFLPGAQKTVAKALLTVNPNVVYIAGNTQPAKDLLLESLQLDGTKVILAPNVDMDLTGYESIYIREGVIFTSDDGFPPRPVRTARNPGPRIFTTSRPKPLFMIECNGDPDAEVKPTIIGDGVRISGIRIIGPHLGVANGDENLETGVAVNACLNVHISNNELAGWSGSALSLADLPIGPRMFNPEAVQIYGNYIHNNQHIGKSGYGIVMGVGAYARIERNVFDLNRHAIAGHGGAGTGYFAKNNLVLKGGGIHGRFYNIYTHQFDVHGDANCPSISSSLWNCGNAGDQFWFYNNSFQYNRDNAVKLRGRPRVAAYIDGNIFAHRQLDNAIKLFTKQRVHLGTGVKRNIAAYDSYGHYGVCDFDGDGKDDFFLATGKTWWMSSAARMHWVFLKASAARLENIGLGDFDGDGKCDVIAPAVGKWEISSGGSGNWKALPGTYTMPFNQLRFADFNGDKRTDVFHRAPDGQWRVISPGVHPWRDLASSSFALADLRFGDFTGDGKADVLSRAGGHWSISVSGKSSWTKINSLSDSFNSLHIADVNNDGKADIVRFKTLSSKRGRWQASWGGRTPWKDLKIVEFTGAPSAPLTPLVTPRYFVGRFDGFPGGDLMHVDYVRVGRVFSWPRNTVLKHNLHPY